MVLRCGEVRKELSGGFACTTNNRMELLAVIKGLEAIRWEGAQVQVFSDSTYVVNTITQGWKRKKNHDLWAQFDALAPRFQLTFNWIRGHAGHPENDTVIPGLPIIRTSPDHGTAFEMAGRDQADPRSMRAAIFTAIDIWRNRQDWEELQEGKMPERFLTRENGKRRLPY